MLWSHVTLVSNLYHHDCCPQLRNLILNFKTGEAADRGGRLPLAGRGRSGSDGRRHPRQALRRLRGRTRRGAGRVDLKLNGMDCQKLKMDKINPIALMES